MITSGSIIELEQQNGSILEEEQCNSLILMSSSDNNHSISPSTPTTINKNEVYQQTANDDVKKILKNPLIKKSIAKLYKSQSKQFTKKQIMVLPYFNMVREISSNHLITLFGCLEIETYYQDYQDPYDKRMHVPVSMAKDFQLQVVDIVMSPLSYSGITDFEFLIDRFIKMQDQNYLEVAKELAVYQYIVKSYLIPSIAKQKSKMLKSQKKKEDFTQAQQEFVKYFKERIRTQNDPSSFYDYELYRTNYMTGEIELFQSGFSFSLSSLLGVEIDQIDNLVFRGQNYFNEQIGEFRLKFFLFILKSINNEMKQSDPYPFILRTYDGLVINCDCYLEYVQFEDRPSWIDKDEMYGIIFRFDINVNQIKAILELRSKQSNQDLEATTISLPNTVEYQMYSEIFLEKFYPEFSDKQNKEIEENSNSSNNMQNNKIFSKKGLIFR